MDNEDANMHNWDAHDAADTLITQFEQNYIKNSNEPSQTQSSSDPQQGRFTCDYCSKTFAHAISFYNHLQQHRSNMHMPQQADHISYYMIQIPNYTFSCKYCSQTFDSPEILMQHMKSQHSNIFYCPVCQKTFKQKYHLYAHMAQHTGQKSFVCPFCEKGFARKDTMEVHLRVHSDERMFECEVCGAKFKQKGHLTRHMNVHLERINVQCEICGKQFYRMDYYNNHMKRQHMNID